MFRVTRFYPRLTSVRFHADTPKPDVVDEVKKIQKQLDEFKKTYDNDTRDAIIDRMFKYFGLVFLGFAIIERR